MVMSSSSPCCTHADQRKGKGPVGNFFHRSGVVGLGSRCRIKHGCLAQASSVIPWFPESLLKWGTHIPSAASQAGNSHMVLQNSSSSRVPSVLGRISSSCCRCLCSGGKRGSSSSAGRASRCPWMCSSGFDVLAVHDMETVSEPSGMGFALWRHHSPGKHLHGLPRSW